MSLSQITTDELRAELERRAVADERDEYLNDVASSGIPAEVVDYMETRLQDEGLFPEFSEPEQAQLLFGMWMHAVTATEAIEDEVALRTNRRVADKVIAAFLALYVHDEVAEELR